MLHRAPLSSANRSTGLGLGIDDVGYILLLPTVYFAASLFFPKSQG